MAKLKTIAVFHTLDGECTLDGPLQWSTFIRTAGCNLRCWKSSGFCDAPHSLDMHYPWPALELTDIVSEVEKYKPCNRVTVTGGEPLLFEEEVLDLCIMLKARGYKVTIETSGSLPVEKAVKTFDCVIMDVKPPATEMSKKNLPRNMDYLSNRDYCKFVIQDRNDYEWAKQYLRDNPTKAKVAMGPRHGFLEPAVLIEWLREDKLFNIRINIQTHKYIWPETVMHGVESLKVVDYEGIAKKEV